jgi:phage baseplate assembly protein W
MEKDIFKPANKTWKDLDLNFSSHPATEDLTFLINASAIKRSVRNLLLTNKGEKLFNPTFGSDVTATLFEDMDVVSVSFIKDSITDLLSTHEPRIVTTKISLSNTGNNFSVRIEYYMISHPEELQVVETLMERIR